jgi:hypothetical protein
MGEKKFKEITIMKNVSKVFGIIAFIVVISISLTACESMGEILEAMYGSSSSSSGSSSSASSQEEVRWMVWVTLGKPEGGTHRQQTFVWAATAREAEAEGRKRVEAANPPSFTFISASASRY